MRPSSQNVNPPGEISGRKPARKRGQIRVQALLQAAEAVFATRGYDAATMTEIAERAGASIGSLYQFFPTKELVAEALHALMIDACIDRLTALAANDATGPIHPADITERALAAFLAFIAERPALAVLADRRSIDKTLKAATRARLRATIAALLATATPRPSAEVAGMLAVVILAMMRAVQVLGDEPDLAWQPEALAILRQMLRDKVAELSQ